MTSLITNLTGAFSDAAMLKLVRDPVLNAGSRFLFDVSNTLCNALATGTLSSGQTLTNMVDSAPVATVSSSTNPLTNNGFDGGGKHLGMSLAAVAANGGTFNLGTSYDLQDLGTPNHDFLVITWLRLDTTQVASQANSTILTLGGSSTNLFNIDCGTANGAPRASANARSGVPVHRAFTGFTKDVPQQIAIAHRYNGGSPINSIYLNGAFLEDYPLSHVDYTDLSASSLTWGSARIAGKLYAAYMEDLTLSEANPLAQVQTDYAMRSSKFAA